MWRWRWRRRSGSTCANLMQQLSQPDLAFHFAAIGKTDAISNARPRRSGRQDVDELFCGGDAAMCCGKFALQMRGRFGCRVFTAIPDKHNVARMRDA